LVFSSNLLGIVPSFPQKEVRTKPGTVHKRLKTTAVDLTWRDVIADVPAVAYCNYAKDCFRLLDLPDATIAQIMRINAQELDVVTTPNPLEGFLDRYPHMMWRRAVRRAELAAYLDYEARSADNPEHAWNYVSVYRWATPEELIQYQRRPTLLVVAIMGNLDLARHVA
jgi:hypothetical protein